MFNNMFLHESTALQVYKHTNTTNAKRAKPQFSNFTTAFPE